MFSSIPVRSPIVYKSDREISKKIDGDWMAPILIAICIFTEDSLGIHWGTDSSPTVSKHPIDIVATFKVFRF